MKPALLPALKLVIRALQAGKRVSVEKPPALNEMQLAKISAQLAETSHPLLMVGFNRRFAPLAVHPFPRDLTHETRNFSTFTLARRRGAAFWRLRPQLNYCRCREI